ncbi:MAG TPA: aminotransferase DegT [Hyphomonadaceae bacterium]|nr:aminotransferase DegT [Hyphomonadaceae bacterium]
MQFIDLHAQRQRLGGKIEAAIQRVLDSGQFILGPEIVQLEQDLAQFAGAKHALTCANGTDALALALMAINVQAGDAIFCPSFSFCATAEIIPWFGAEPVFVDIDRQTYLMDEAHLDATIAATLADKRLRPKAIIGVCLFGQTPDYATLRQIADRYGLALIADNAQGFGATRHGRHPAADAHLVTTSFYPAKPLGCYGDGGAVLTNDAAMAEVIDSLRVHGKATAADLRGQTFEHDPKYLNFRIGMNSRLDALQAAILREKLAIFADEIDARQDVADTYAQRLRGVVSGIPTLANGARSTWAQYTIEHPDRDALRKHLASRGIPTAVYYPAPLHRSPAFAHYGQGPGGLPHTDHAAERVLSLPMHAYLSATDQNAIIEAIDAFQPDRRL